MALAVIGALLLLAAATGLGETLAPGERRQGGVSATLTTFRQLLVFGKYIQALRRF